jgi:hypothetical protein
MNRTTTAKLPKKTSAKVNDADNPAWTEDMLVRQCSSVDVGRKLHPRRC